MPEDLLEALLLPRAFEFVEAQAFQRLLELLAVHLRVRTFEVETAVMISQPTF